MKILSLFLACFFFHSSASKEIPSFLRVCHRDDPDISQCVTASVEDLRPYLVTGVPEYHIPKLEPLILNGLISEQIGGLHIDTTNVSTFGCSDYFVRNINLDMDTYLISLDVELPKLRVFAHYTVDGKILVVPVKGNGHIEANITDCFAHATLKGELFEKEGDNYLKFNAVDLDVEIGGGRVEIKDMFNGDKVLLNMINEVINKNLDMFMVDLLPSIQKALSKVFMDTGNAIVENFTFKQLFPH